MKKCCKEAKKLFGINRDYKKCPLCEHIYCDEYPNFTYKCKCGFMPLIKAL